MRAGIGGAPRQRLPGRRDPRAADPAGAGIESPLLLPVGDGTVAPRAPGGRSHPAGRSRRRGAGRGGAEEAELGAHESSIAPTCDSDGAV